MHISNRVNMKYLLKYMKQYRAQSLIAPLFKMMEAVFDLLVPYIIADMVNIGVATHDGNYLLQRTLLLFLMALLGFLCTVIAQYFSAKVATSAAAGLRHDLFAHVQSLSYRELDGIGQGTLITRLTSDINQVQNGLNLFLRLFMRSPFIVFGSLFMAFRINTKISLIFLGVIVLLALVVFGLMKLTSPMYQKVQKKLDSLTVKTREILLGVRVIRAFRQEAREVREFREANGDLISSQLAVGRLSALSNPLTYIIINLGIVLVLYLGARQVNEGTLISGDMIALVNYMNQILVELVKLANLIVTISRALASLKRVEIILDTESSMHFGEETYKAAKTAVEFEHVSLKYVTAQAESLEDVSFEVKENETVGIIGSTGSGKSTLVQLIARYYDATDGEVRLFEKPAASYSKEAVRNMVSMVAQSAQLFSGTIRSNLMMAKADATDEEMIDALKKAQAYEFVEKKENGLDAIVEQGGRNFSGGQRQRLSIARSILKNSPIIIFDDSSSALDYQTDARLRKAIRELKATVFIVSQRTSSIAHCDRILVLEEGRLVGEGKHEELLKNCEVYQEIYASQFQKGGEKA